MEMQARLEVVERVKQGAFHAAIVVGFRIVRDETLGSEHFGARNRQTKLLCKPLGDREKLFRAPKPQVAIEVGQFETGAQGMHDLGPELGFDLSLAGCVRRPRRTPLRPVRRRSPVIAPPPETAVGRYQARHIVRRRQRTPPQAIPLAGDVQVNTPRSTPGRPVRRPQPRRTKERGLAGSPTS